MRALSRSTDAHFRAACANRCLRATQSHTRTRSNVGAHSGSALGERTRGADSDLGAIVMLAQPWGQWALSHEKSRPKRIWPHLRSGEAELRCAPCWRPFRLAFGGPPVARPPRDMRARSPLCARALGAHSGKALGRCARARTRGAYSGGKLGALKSSMFVEARQKGASQLLRCKTRQLRVAPSESHPCRSVPSPETAPGVSAPRVPRVCASSACPECMPRQVADLGSG